jgi:hypothetical protein
MEDVKPTGEIRTGSVKSSETKPVQEFVKKEDFDQAMSILMKSIETLSIAVAQKKETVSDKKIKAEGTTDFETPIPPQWRSVVDEVLGEDVGMMISYPDNGGFKFTLSIPREKSNVGDEHWKMFNHDWRTKMLNPSEGIAGVRKHCELVKQNLNTKH